MRRLITSRSTSSVFAAAFFLNINRNFVMASNQGVSSPLAYDYIVIGGGSGGLASAKRAATYGAKVAIIEGDRYGGTCVNVGCVPKKVMFNAGFIADVLKEAHEFGFTIKDKPTFDWGAMKSYRDAYIKRLNSIYESGLDSAKITRYQGMGSFLDSNTLEITSSNAVETIKITGKHILIATGGKPKKLGVPGEDFCIDSNGFFALETQPKKVAIIGAGYIAVELAGVFNSLGTETNLFVRGGTALRNFDPMITTHLDASMKKSGIEVISTASMKEVTKDPETKLLTIFLQDGRSYSGFEEVICAIGREPLTQPLQLHNAGVSTDRLTSATTVSADLATNRDSYVNGDTSGSGYILADDYQNTNIQGVYALGDVCGKVELTPMAIAAGRRLADRIFGNIPDAKADYDGVPTVVFSHPVIGTIGLTETEARKKFNENDIKIYTSNFVNLWYGSFYKGGVGDKPITKYKLICVGKEEKVIGLHCIGMASDEVIQGFGVAMKMGATKRDFDSCIAIHPTAAEELVTMPPWGLSPPPSATADRQSSS